MFVYNLNVFIITLQELLEILYKLRVCFIRKIRSTGKNSTRKYIIVQDNLLYCTMFDV